MNQVNTKISNTQYDSLINDYSKNSSAKEKSITTGKIVAIENDIVTIDVGLKSEGRVPLNEFSRPGQSSEIQVFRKWMRRQDPATVGSRWRAATLCTRKTINKYLRFYKI